MTISGSCLCGLVKFSSPGKIAMACNCHCRDCKKASGSGYAPTLFVPEESVEITGDVKYYKKLGDSGKALHRGFCPNCGSQLFGRPEAWPGMLAIRPGSLDDLSAYKPSINIFADQTPSWDCMDPELGKFERAPDG